MNENLFEAQYDVSKKSKFRKFYESNKLLIFSTISIFLIFVVILSFYFQNIEKKKAFLSDSYIEAIVLLDKENNNKAKDLLSHSIDMTANSIDMKHIYEKGLEPADFIKYTLPLYISNFLHHVLFSCIYQSSAETIRA